MNLYIYYVSFTKCHSYEEEFPEFKVSVTFYSKRLSSHLIDVYIIISSKLCYIINELINTIITK